MEQTCRLSHLSSVCRSVCPENILWQNGWLDPGAVWDGECGRSRDGCIRWEWWSSKGKRQFGGKFGESHCNQWELCCVVVWSAWTDRAVVWTGAGGWGGPRHSCIRWGPRAPRGKGVTEIFAPLFQWRMGLFSHRNIFDSYVKSWEYFGTDNITLESAFRWLSEDVLKFEVYVGVHEKYAKM